MKNPRYLPAARKKICADDTVIMLAVIERQYQSGYIESWKQCPSAWLPALEEKFGVCDSRITLKVAHKTALEFLKITDDFLASEQLLYVKRDGIESAYVVTLFERMKTFELIKQNFVKNAEV
jgi:hypothetical protein